MASRAERLVHYSALPVFQHLGKVTPKGALQDKFEPKNIANKKLCILCPVPQQIPSCCGQARMRTLTQEDDTATTTLLAFARWLQN